jgi:hypothetical protein
VKEKGSRTRFKNSVGLERMNEYGQADERSALT